jgi:patatin-like phospholipase/acyl hydrolase
MKKVRILSIDGGGIRGILPGTLLTYMEQKIKEKTNDATATIGQYFDFIAGTSTGGILACCYLIPNENNTYKFSAAEALDLYMDRGDEIFDVTLRQRIKSLGGIKDEKYDATELVDALNDYFDGVKLSDLLKPCLVTSYDIRSRNAKFFTSHDATELKFDFFVKDVARATSAAPTYFEPARIKSLAGTPYPLIDGGVFANNPTLCAYAEARTVDFRATLNDPEKPKLPTAKDMVIVSLGTGGTEKSYPYTEFKDAGMIKWIKPLIDIMMSGNAETVDFQVRQIFNTLSGTNKADYHRIEPEIITASSQMDEADVKNLKALHADGISCVEKCKKELDEIVDKLIANH